jgi:hypothetical protein
VAEIWLDTSLIGDIAAGSRALETLVRRLGVTLLITPKVREELINPLGNPFGDSKAANLPPAQLEAFVAARAAVLKRLGILLDTQGSADVRRELFEKQFKFKPGRTVVRAIEESDAIILSEVAASAQARGNSVPVLLTTDQRLVNNADARLFGVDIQLPNQTSLDSIRNERASRAAPIRDQLDRVQNQLDLISGEHKAQKDIIQGSPSITGFIGFWTNRLFNSDPPELVIWDPTAAAVARARRALREDDLGEALAATLRAQGELSRAAAVYFRWKDGIEAAGTRMKILIGAVAATLILAAIAGFALAAAAPAEQAGAGAAASVQELTRLVAQGSNLAVRIAATQEGTEAAAALQEFEQTMEAVENLARSTMN